MPDTATTRGRGAPWKTVPVERRLSLADHSARMPHSGTLPTGFPPDNTRTDLVGRGLLSSIGLSQTRRIVAERRCRKCATKSVALWLPTRRPPQEKRNLLPLHFFEEAGPGLPALVVSFRARRGSHVRQRRLGEKVPLLFRRSSVVGSSARRFSNE